MPTQLPETMQAWRKHLKSQEPHRDTIPVPSCPPSGFLLRVLAAGVCHSDVPLVAAPEDRPRPAFYCHPYTLGHEACGEIISIGSSIPTTSGAAQLRVGDRVSVNPVAGCDSPACPDCSHGFPQLCQNPSGSHHGLGQDGAFAPYMAVSHRAVLKVPEGVSNAAAAVTTDAVMTSHHAVITRAGIKNGDVVFMFGLGGLGFNALQIVKAMGVEVYVSDVRDGPLEEARALGVPEDHIVPVGKDVQEWVTEKGLDGKLDIVVDFAGAQQTFSDAAVIVRRGGTVVSVGLLDHEHKTNHILNITKAITILYTFGGTNTDIVQGLEKIAAGTLTPRVETAPMSEFANVLKDLHEGRIKSRMVLIPEGVDV